MDDLISREALKNAIATARTNYNTCPDYNELFKYFSDVVSAMIDELPAVDAEPVRHGRWVFDKNANDWGIGGYVCSECKAKNDNLPCTEVAVPSMFMGTKYCPSCGAKMDMEKEKE